MMWKREGAFARTKQGGIVINDFLRKWELGRIEMYKDTKINGRLGFGLVSREVAKEMMINNHYSSKWQTSFGLLNVGVYKEGRLLGVASFGNLMNPKSFKKLLVSDDPKSVIELNRLWIDDELGYNAETTLLAVAFKYMKNQHKEIKLVQSFADGRLGCGTIYKASNFKYFGSTNTMFIKRKTGEIVHSAPLTNSLRPKMYTLTLELIDGELSFFKTKSHRYLYPLTKKIELKMKEKEYPVYSKGVDDIEDVVLTCNHLMKVYYYYSSQEVKEKIINYAKSLYSDNEIAISKETALKWYCENNKTPIL